MPKARVHILAKELGIETKDLVAHLEKLGMPGRKAQSLLEDEEVARVRAALGPTKRPKDLNLVIDQVSKEKGIDKVILIDALEKAMLSAAMKVVGAQRKITAKYNPDLGEVELFEAKQVVEDVKDPRVEITLLEAQKSYGSKAGVGEAVLYKLDSLMFGRIAAQAAKQNIVQRIRDTERVAIYNQFKGSEDQLIDGTVQRFEAESIIVNLGRADALLPQKEQVPVEHYRKGDRIRAYILNVEMTERGPVILLSRKHHRILVKLLEQQVPEVSDGIIKVKRVVRDPGYQAKIAVDSIDPKVDPVLVCIGDQRKHLQAIVQELRGEKVEIIHWSEDPAEYVRRALAPAKTSGITIDEDKHTLKVSVPYDQFSIAFGEGGKNVVLVSDLVGWQVEVVPEVVTGSEIQELPHLISGPIVSSSPAPKMSGWEIKVNGIMSEALSCYRVGHIRSALHAAYDAISIVCQEGFSAGVGRWTGFFNYRYGVDTLCDKFQMAGDLPDRLIYIGKVRAAMAHSPYTTPTQEETQAILKDVVLVFSLVGIDLPQSLVDFASGETAD